MVTFPPCPHKNTLNISLDYYVVCYFVQHISDFTFRIKMKYNLFCLERIIFAVAIFAPPSLAQNSPPVTPPTTAPPLTSPTPAPTVPAFSKSAHPFSYLVPGTAIEIFDRSALSLVLIHIPNHAPDSPTNNLTAALMVVDTQLLAFSKQNNLLFAGNSIRGLQLRADVLFNLVREASEFLQASIKVFKSITLFYSKSSTPLSPQECMVNISFPSIAGTIEKCHRILSAELAANAGLNAKYQKEGDTIIIPKHENLPVISGDDIGRGLVISHLAVSEILDFLRELHETMQDFHGSLESLFNGQIPPSILSHLELTATCLRQGVPDRISHIVCSASPQYIDCLLHIMQSGEGTSVNKLIPVPYHSQNSVLALKFPPHLAYKVGTGKTISLAECSIMGNKATCPHMKFTADKCLEQLQTPPTPLLSSCEIQRIDPKPPLITVTPLGTLVAQQSATPMIIEYGDHAIVSNTFILSNCLNIEVLHGSHKIIIPKVDRCTNIFYDGTGNFTSLQMALRSRHWSTTYYSFLPNLTQEILILISIILQTLFLIPMCYKISDSIMQKKGYILLPYNDRSLLRRYSLPPLLPAQPATHNEYSLHQIPPPPPRGILLSPTTETHTSCPSLASFKTDRSSDSAASNLRLHNQRILNLHLP